jgi:hypothetical protein
MKRTPSILLLIGAVFCSSVSMVLSAAAETGDVCIYGATGAGVAAAVQAGRMGKKVILIEPSNHLGGLSSGGLGATDIGNKAAIGGMAREFYHRIAQHYAQDSAWVQEGRQQYFARHGSHQAQMSDLASADATMWTFEPHVAEAVFKDMVRESGARLILQARLQSVAKSGPSLRSLTLENGTTVMARIFIDASYEGDLMAAAGVSFRVGREANGEFGETLDGVRGETPKHQFLVPVDPYRRPGDPASGLLDFVQSGELDAPGTGDRKVQAYNFRLCFTTNLPNRLPLTAPPHYDPSRYELLARYLEALIAAGKKPTLEQFWNPIWMPNGKTDINNNGPFSTDFIGASYEYPTATPARREAIWREHQDYTLGLLTFLATSPRVPENIRAEMRLWGPCKDEFLDTAGWPRQLYVREARRMRSSYVMTEHNCRGTVQADDSVGLGAYNMDSHNCQRIVRNGRVENEGDVQVSVKPYPIAYRAIVPKADECGNLLVPVCLSATHIAYGSIRMEPVFMILGQSAATAGCLAIDREQPVQQLAYPALKARLLADQQVLSWAPVSHDSPSSHLNLR